MPKSSFRPKLRSKNTRNAILSKRGRLLQRLSKDVELFNSRLLSLNELSKEICEDIRTTLDFDIAAIQLIDFEEQVIQTVYGSGHGGEWYKIAKHTLEGDPRFLDIQASIALARPPRLEVVKGWDPRLDEFIFKKYRHQHYIRAFIPLIVVRDSEGHLAEAQPEQFGFEPIAGSQARIIELTPKAALIATKSPFEVIGTLEVGFENSDPTRVRGIPNSLAKTLFERACRIAAVLCRATLFHVLELVTDSVKKITRANCASLHLPLRADLKGSAYNVWLGPSIARELNPRQNGLGEQVIRTQKPSFLSFETSGVDDFNPAVHAVGIKTYGAFPLLFRTRRQQVDGAYSGQFLSESKEGVMYVAFTQARHFTKEEIVSLQPFIGMAVDAIRNVMYHTRAVHAARQLTNLHEIALLLANEDDSWFLLRSIAGHALNILAADLVIIYEYDAAQRCFRPGPAAAGRRQNPESGPGALDGSYTPPLRLIEESESVFAERQECVKALYSDDEEQLTVNRFIEEEQIRSAAAVLLRLGQETVGLLLVNYRRPHIFTEYERKFIETLASTAAVPIGMWRRQYPGLQSHARAVEVVAGKFLHEFQPIIGLLDACATEEVPNYNDSGVKHELDRLKQMVLVIEGLSKKAAPKGREFDLAALIRDIAAAQAQGEGLVALEGPAPMLTQGDPGRLRLVICNGLRNAIEAVSSLPKDGRRPKVIIDWGVTGSETWLVIVDNGPGLGHGVQSPFESGTSTKKGHRGVGLPTARQAMMSMKGDISLAPGTDGGAVFKIYWNR